MSATAYLHPTARCIVAILALCLLSPMEFYVNGVIPITPQSLVVLLVGILLGPGLGAIAVMGYLGLGCIGLPVFANGSSGVEKLWGPTGGFLCAFPIAAWIAGSLWKYNLSRAYGFSALILGHMVILIIGFTWLGLFTGYDGLLLKITPLLPGLAIKVLLGMAILLVVKKLFKSAWAK